jgi:hypothetical protein
MRIDCAGRRESERQNMEVVEIFLKQTIQLKITNLR